MIKGKGSSWLFGFENPGECGKEEEFSEERDGRAAVQKKGFWIGCRDPLFRGSGKAKLSSLECHTDPCRKFSRPWGAVATFEPGVFLPLADARFGRNFNHLSGGKGDQMAKKACLQIKY